MPGLFGGIGCADPDIYGRLSAEFERTWGDCESRQDAGWLLGAHAFGGRQALVSTDRHHYAVDGEYSVYAQPAGGSGQFRHDFHIDEGALRLGPNHMGNVALIDTVDQTLHLAVEWSGTFPLYFVRHDGGVIFSSQLRPLAGITRKLVDDLGLLEFLRNGFTFGGRSIFVDIRRLLPGQSVHYNVATASIGISETSRAWVGSQEASPQDVIAKEAWRLLENAIRRSIPTTEAVGLMMSAGWDSRTLLAALKTRPPGRLICYSHGDTASRELNIVARLASSSHVDCRLEPIDARVLNLHDLKQGFSRVENVVFPHWHRAGRLLREMGVAAATAGVYGEVLGGHYGPSMLLGGSHRVIAVGRNLLRAAGRPSGPGPTLKATESLLRVQPFGHHWYLSREFEDAIPSACDRINADVQADIVRLQRRGIRSPEHLIEAFVAEHRGSHYIDAQLLSCRAHVDVALPFAQQELLEFVSCVPVHAKIHNALNRRMLQRYAPKMLRFPMAATLVPASAPLLLQEASRLVRKAYEDTRLGLYSRSYGRLGRPRLGWVDFEFLRSGDTLMDLIEDLKCRYWDRGALARRLNALASDRAIDSLHPIYDQMAKVYTVDLLCR